MNVLVIGGGGREHALVWKIAQSPKVKKVFCAPGNAGIADAAECVPIAASDIPRLLDFARREKIDLTVVGPEGPLSEGIVDVFEKAGLRIFGATRRAAEIEASKSFAKDLMVKYGIPTARGQSFKSIAAARRYLRQINAPVVVKADGLAAGKGVIVCATRKEAEEALERVMLQREFGDAGSLAVIEECLTGEEASFLAFTDGKTVLPMPSSQDHKAIFDDDRGPNTGGMGAYSPAPVVDRLIHKKIMQEVMLPIVKAMAAEGRPYKGVLYAGLMIDGDQIKVLEFNGRFGDPETQPQMMRLESDLVDLLEAAVDQDILRTEVRWSPDASGCVVVASGGYPVRYEKGKIISGLTEAAAVPGVAVFHAGTKFENGQYLTTGGRVLGVCATAPTLAEVMGRAYEACAKVYFEAMYYRRDIGAIKEER
jgi:phosphoribosylamine--glycine ligase